MASSLVPSPDEATEYHISFGIVFETQVVPESAEVYTALVCHASATSFVPSEEEATEYQERLGATVVVHVAPESVEV